MLGVKVGVLTGSHSRLTLVPPFRQYADLCIFAMSSSSANLQQEFQHQVWRLPVLPLNERELLAMVQLRLTTAPGGSLAAFDSWFSSLTIYLLTVALQKIADALQMARATACLPRQVAALCQMAASDRNKGLIFAEVAAQYLPAATGDFIKRINSLLGHICPKLFRGEFGMRCAM